MAWRIEFAEPAAREFAALDKAVAVRVRRFLEERVATADDPRAIGERLKGAELGDFWRFRVGDWRLIARIEDEVLCVIVLRLGHRRLVYR